jgi:plastocyanin
MTDTRTVDEKSQDEQLPELQESASLGAEGHHAAHERLKDRVILPFLLPLLSMAAVGLLAINVSRILLAGSEDTALAIGITLLLVILVGATVLAAMPRAKTSSLVVTAGLGVFVLAMAGLIALGPSLDDGTGGAATGYVPPTGKPQATVSVTAGPGLTFNGVAFTGNYTATPGVVQINYGGASGHTLAIQDPKFAGFELGTSAGAKKSGNVELAAGKYTIYCTVPGHEAAGMKATITVAG